MSAFPIFLTPAGRAAMVNADNTGTQAGVVASIGISASSAGVSGGELTGEFKRLTTFAGSAISDDTIHVTIRDDSADVYSMRAFALYLDDGTLLAWYSQATVILEKSAQAMLLLATDIQFQQLNATTLEFGDTTWTNPLATTTVFGVLRLATNPEAVTGEIDSAAITPKSLAHVLNERFGVGAPSAFVKGLLGLATAALIRTALELGNAATRNTGANNGLDADLLDGQHGSYYLAWENLSGKPPTFPPGAHSHAWTDLAGVPATASRWPTWLEVADKPLTFAPSAHTHAAADITAGTFADARIPELAMAKISGLQTALDGKASSGHTHSIANVANLQTALDSKASRDLSNANGVLPEACLPERLRTNAKLIGDWNTALENGWYMAANGLNAPGSDWYIGQVEAHNSNWVTQTVRQFTTDGSAESMRWRRDRNNGSWNPWTRVRETEQELDARYGVRNTDVTFRDVRASRGDGTGVIYFGTGDRYLYFDSTRYILRDAPLNVGGTVTAPAFAQSSSRRYKTDVETIDADRALALLSEIRFTDYRLRADGSYQAGVIAEELADGPLDFIVQRTDNGDPDSVNYQPLFVIACAALQRIASRLDALEAKA